MWEKSRVHSLMLTQRQTNILFVVFFKGVMKKNKESLSIFLLLSVVIIWGFGYLFTKFALNAGATTSFINLCRFSLATICFAFVFFKKIRITKQGLLFGSIVGFMLFGGFYLQTEGLLYTTTPNNAFFASSSIVFVPFFAQLFMKKKNPKTVYLGIAIAVVGLIVLNYGGMAFGENVLTPQMMIGNVMSLGAAICFALQTVLTSYTLLNKQVNNIELTFIEFASCAVFFAITFFAKDFSPTVFTNINWAEASWTILFLGFLNTGFAYTAQIYVQQHVHPTKVSLFLSLECFLGALIPIIWGESEFTWSILIGGALMVVAVFIVEFFSKNESPPENKTLNNKDSLLD